MKESFHDIDDNIGDEARDQHVFFDDNSWDKIETSLNEDDAKSPASFADPAGDSSKMQYPSKDQF